MDYRKKKNLPRPILFDENNEVFIEIKGKLCNNTFVKNLTKRRIL